MSTRGMVLGKFMPPHAGHCLLVDFARSWVDELDVLLFGTGDDEIPADARVAWARELFAGANVQHFNQLLPDFEDAPEAFVNIVAEVVNTTFPDGLEYVFGSAVYGEQLAELAGARYVPVDPDCELLPVRASELREDPLEHWEFLPHCVRPHYVKRVCLIGPDGTGKSALAEQLAVHYDTVAAYAYKERANIGAPMTLGADGVVNLVRGQLSTEDALARHANRVLFCDTDALTLAVWAKQAVGQCPPDVEAMARSRRYDLYLLMDVDMQWPEQGYNLDASTQSAAFEAYRQQLIERDLKYLRLDGDYDTRFRIAADAVDLLLGKPSGRPPRPGEG